ncbi:M23 family metallopeptidase [Streptomyces pratensis]|uniref:M23 family metallopeptidase n=1 Tax=Streptomyces pratensis TaxID=1169025 RepID=UPI00301A43DE
MNDQHPHAGHVGYDSQPTGSYDTDPLFGSLPGGHRPGDDAGYDAVHQANGYAGSPYDGGYETSYTTGQPNHSGQFDSSSWDTGAQRTAPYDGHGYAAAEPADHRAHQQWDSSAAWQQSTDQDGAGQWTTTDSGAFPAAAFPSAPYDTGAYDTGTYDTGAYDTGTYPAGTAYGTGDAYGTADAYDTGAYPVGTYSATVVADTGTYATTALNTGGYETGTHSTGAYGTDTYDTGAYDATAWNSGATPEDARYEPEHTSYPLYEHQAPEATATTTSPAAMAGPDGGPQEEEASQGPSSTAELPVLTAKETPEPGDAGGFPDPYSVSRAAPRPPGPRNRARRRSPAKRSALLTVAVPSACVMGVAGIAAASVSGMTGGEEKQGETTTSLAVADPSTVKPVAANNQLDSQLEQLDEGSNDFRERASRTQERIDLRERQAAEKKKREEEAARREALRPKFVMPVKQHGLSAYYGQAGINWMSVHTGIDFPVGYGAPVMAATDGTVRTQWNSAYGNMAIVTMADGTETWYCHLSSTKIRSGPVKAGDVIGYAGDSGNSTGPHLHFEVRPGGGASIDPLVWLRSHGVNPT